MLRRIFSIALAAGAGILWAETRFDLMVQGSADNELKPLLAALQLKREVNIGSWTFWTGRIGKKSVVISRTEVGPINAAAATAIGIQIYHPKAIINQGTAGAHNRAYKLWDIVLGARTTDYSAFKSDHGPEGTGTRTARWKPHFHKLRLDNQNLVELRSFLGDPTLLEAARKIRYRRGKVHTGNIGSAYQFNRELDHIAWLNKTYGTDSEDMESAYAAGVATGMKVPFLAIRIISDTEWEHPAVEKIAGEYSAEFTVDLIKSLP